MNMLAHSPYSPLPFESNGIKVAPLSSLSLRERVRVKGSKWKAVLASSPHPGLLPRGKGTHIRCSSTETKLSSSTDSQFNLMPLPSGRGHFRWPLAILTLLCLLTSRAHAEKLPSSLLGGAVTYKFPKGWSLQHVSRSKKLEALQFVIIFSTPGQPTQKANVILIAEPNTEGLTVADFSAKKISKTYKPVADYSEGDSWRTVLSQVPDSKPPYAVLDRFGVTPKGRVHLRIVLPSTGDEQAKWPTVLAKDSNEVINNLGLNLKNAVGVELRHANGNWELLQSKTVKQNTLRRPVPPQPQPKPSPLPTEAPPAEFDTHVPHTPPS